MMSIRFSLLAALAATIFASGSTETHAQRGRHAPLSAPAACTASSTNRPLAPGSQLYGVTLDDVSNTQGELDALVNLPHMPIARIYFDPTVNPSSYVKAIQTFYPKSYIMGEVADSSDMKNFTTSSITSQTNNLIIALGPCVDVWEIGNEVNGNWLLSRGSHASDASATMAKIEAVYNAVMDPANPTARSKLTALTFFYEGEPSDPNNCISTGNGGNDMFTWISKNFLASPTATTEAIRTTVNYVLISWYPDQCNNLAPDWPAIFEKLAGLFPNSYVGFGEIGTANADENQSYEQNLIIEYYPMVRNRISWPGTPDEVSYMQSHYVGGYFWWYFAEEMVPRNGSVLYQTLWSAMQ
ncbi:MAG TPA: hypothetical protein VH684_14525 [Xanthobacteraceae bacterium]